MVIPFILQLNIQKGWQGRRVGGWSVGRGDQEGSNQEVK